MNKIVCGAKLSTLNGTEYNADNLIKSNMSLPETFSYKNYTPKVSDQGNEPLCVPYTLSINKGWFDRVKSGKEKYISYNYLFDNRPDKNMEGMEPKQALEFLRKTGWVEDKNYKNGRLTENAPLYKIRMYALCNSFLTAKKCLFLNGPLLFALPVCNYDTEFWKGGKIIGYHAAACIGWNETGFILQNSWGPNWAFGGYTTISYEDFGRYVKECWTVFNE